MAPLGLLLRRCLGGGFILGYAATDPSIAGAVEEIAPAIPPKTSPAHWGFGTDPHSPFYFDGVELADMEALGVGWDQFLELHKSFGPGHWGPSDWGWLLGAGTAALLLSFGALLSATRPVEAIFSFLVLLLSLLLPFFCLEAEYVAAIHLMVYPGAILIFFSFATLTTDQRGHWDQWNPWAGGRAQSPTGAWLSRCGEQLRVLLVALPLLGFWWALLGQRVKGSPLPRSGELLPKDYLFSARPLELLRSSDMVALGLEIFQRRLLSLTLLGLLLLLAFLSALELLAPRRRRRSSNLFPRLGALLLPLGVAAAAPETPIHWSLRVYLDEQGNPAGLPVERGKLLLASWQHLGGDGWLLPCLGLLALGLGALSQRRYAFLHSFLLLEALGLLLNLVFVLVGSVADDLGGSLLVLFTVAVAAAETAVGLALFLALSQGSGLPQRRAALPSRRRLVRPGSNFAALSTQTLRTPR